MGQVDLSARRCPSFPSFFLYSLFPLLHRCLPLGWSRAGKTEKTKLREKLPRGIKRDDKKEGKFSHDLQTPTHGQTDLSGH